MKKLFTLFICSLIYFFPLAHEFWLLPEKFIYKWNENINVRFLVGENFEGENWKGDRSRVNKLELYFSGVKDDITKALSDETGDSLQIKLLDEGTAMIVFNSNNAYIELDSADFNTYLLEEGLNEAFEYRLNHHEIDSAGREYYQRSAKTIFQVGKKFTSTFGKETSLPLDIIPQQNPYSLKNGDSLEVKILFQKDPLARQFVGLWQRFNDITVTTGMITDGDGTIKFPVQTKGTWMISTVKMIRLENDEKTNPIAIGWQSYWGSCTWGYQ